MPASPGLRRALAVAAAGAADLLRRTSFGGVLLSEELILRPANCAASHRGRDDNQLRKACPCLIWTAI